jgi:CheY-like chemotaxis protein
VLEEMAEGWTMRPFAAESGPEALACLEEAWAGGEPFEVVLLDVRMPGMDGFAVAEAMRPNPHMSGATIVMLTSDDRTQDQARCDTLGLSAYLIKPITKRDLFRSLQRALRRRETPVVTPVPVAVPALGAPAATPSRRLRVLVAEDNEVNVRLAVALLKKLGHEAIVVGDGDAAVAAHAAATFDLILMDVQMPVMGGMDAARAIRAAETAAPDRPRVPIVALTARAMKGDREECLAAGMDDYVTKPVRLADLAAALSRQVDGVAPATMAQGDAA